MHFFGFERKFFVGSQNIVTDQDSERTNVGGEKIRNANIQLLLEKTKISSVILTLFSTRSSASHSPGRFGGIGIHQTGLIATSLSK